MKQAFAAKLAFRVIVYILGMFCLAMGVAFSINSNLGVSPVNSLPYIVSKISGIAMSTCVILVFCIYILLQVIILRKEFMIINLIQIFFSTAFGYFMDMAKWIVGDFVIPTYLGKLVMLAISILFIAVGVTLYIGVKLVPMPMEGLTLAIARRAPGIPFPRMKTIVDCIVVITGIVLSFVFLHKLVGIREGTIITAIVTGKVVALLQRFLKPAIDRLCFTGDTIIVEKIVQ